jgi:hypothetical protein
MKKMEQKLEQILEFAPGQTRLTSIDQYIAGTVGLYTPPPTPSYGYGMHAPAMFTPPAMPTFNNDWSNVSTFKYAPAPVWEPPRYEAPKLDLGLSIQPYSRGMELDGGISLYGDKNTAILHDNDTGLDFHHHSGGPGSINYGSQRLGILGNDIKINHYKDFL